MTDGVHSAGLRATAGHFHGHSARSHRAEIHAEASHARRDDDRAPAPEHIDRHRGSTILEKEASTALARRFPDAHRGHSRHADRWHNHGKLATPEHAAGKLVYTAKQIVAHEDPDAAATTIAEIGEQVRTAAAAARLVVRSDAERTEIDAALKYFESGLRALDPDATDAPSQVTGSLRQGARVQVRTQEGDVVELKLRRAVTVRSSAADSDNAGGEVALSTRLGLRLEVNGDINESELAAITAVFEQAASIAEAFFDGDLAAAFDEATGITFDSEQLATISLAFKLKAHAATTYAALARPAAEASSAPEDTAPDAPGAAAAVDRENADSATSTNGANAEPASGAAGLEVPSSVSAPAVSAPAVTSSAETSDASTADPAADAHDAAVARPIASLADLTRLVAEFFAAFIAGLEQLQAAADDDGQTGYRLATAFKLEVLQSVLRVSAPAEHIVAATAVAEAIEQGAYAPEEQSPA